MFTHRDKKEYSTTKVRFYGVNNDWLDLYPPMMDDGSVNYFALCENEEDQEVIDFVENSCGNEVIEE